MISILNYYYDKLYSETIEMQSKSTTLIKNILLTMTRVFLKPWHHDVWLDIKHKLNKINRFKYGKYYQQEAQHAIYKNTWHGRANIMKHKFEEICDK